MTSRDIEYLEAWYYSKHQSQYECITPRGPVDHQKLRPAKVVSVEEIVANVPQTALIAPAPDLVRVLARKGLYPKNRVAQPQYVAYLE